MQSLDLADVHGGLSALSEIAIAYKETIADPVKLEGYLRNVRWFFCRRQLCSHDDLCPLNHRCSST